MSNVCSENNSTFIGLKKSVVLGFVSSTMAIATPEYDIDLFADAAPIALCREDTSLFDQSVDTDEIAALDEKEFSAAMSTLKDIAKFEDGWDGYDAKPISKMSLDLAERFLKAVSVVRGLVVGWDVSPTGRKTVQVEKTTENGYYEIEFFENGKISCFLKNGEKSTCFDMHDVDSAVKWVVNAVS